MNISWIMAPLVGAAIGYITNYLAIKMLLHPYKEVRIGKFRLPFTPGLIPKEKARIAKSLGNVVSEQLLNIDVIESALLSETMEEKIEKQIDAFIDRHRNSPLTVYEIIEKYAGNERASAISEGVSEKVTSALKKAVKEQNFGHLISGRIKEYLQENLKGIARAVLPMFSDSLEHFVENEANKIINDNIDSAAEEAVSDKIEKIKNMRLCEIAEKYKDKISDLKALLIGSYRFVIAHKLPDIINSLNISNMIEERVNSFSVKELEKLIFGIMKKELRMIVYLGALLGMMMGFVNLLF
ncbi:MAG: DUF445 domain-containing protein [Candidatus Ornithomonoglobus sp.]